jgi:molybdopterin converting factor subunit 1
MSDGGPAGAAIEVTARYFAAFRERAGRDRERVSTTAGTAAELYAELARKHGFADTLSRCKVAVNDELADWNVRLSPGDEVLFFPPVAGG